MAKTRTIRYDPYHDLYAVVGVAPEATPAEIQKAFRQRAKSVHPDVTRENTEKAKQAFQTLNEAYEILSDLALRTEYDRQRRDTLGFDFVSAAYAEYAPTANTYEGPTPGTATNQAATAAYGQRRPRYWRSVLEGLITGRSYRYVLAILLVVFVSSGSMIIFLAPQIEVMVNAANVGRQNATKTASALTTAAATVACPNAVVQIIAPTNDAVVTGNTVEIRGKITVQAGWRYDITLIESATQKLLTRSEQFDPPPPETPVLLAPAFPLDGLANGRYSLQVRAFSNNGSLVGILGSCTVNIRLNR